MYKREPEFSTYRDIKILMLSWNIDSCKPADLQGEANNMNFLNDALQSSMDPAQGGDTEPPEIIVVGFQEIVDLEDKKITASECDPGPEEH